jgi:oxygen-dependent protoporphyrinogen oxidase
VAESTAVIGGGITGLTSALDLSADGRTVHLFEQMDVLGGKIAETSIAGRVVPTGPDAFLSRRPEVTELAASLGLEQMLVSPSAASARIFRDGRLHRLPANVLGVPATIELGSTGLISAAGVERAGADLTAPDDRPRTDESVGAMVRRRLGDEVLEYIVDPLLGGINAGDSDRLSIETGAPQLDVLRQRHPSLIQAAADTLAGANRNAGPVFTSVIGGLNRLIDLAVTELRSRPNVELSLGAPATLTRTEAGWSVSGVEVDNVLITTPAASASSLVRPFAPEASLELDAIDYSSVALAVLVAPRETFAVDASISGVLIPRLAGLTVTAVSFATHKWPELSHDGDHVLRVSIGRRNAREWQRQSDVLLLEKIRADLGHIFDTDVPVGPAVLTRWMNSLPQYDVGHGEKVARVDAAVSNVAGLFLAGAWREGLGLPACVESAHRVAREIQ